MDVGGRVEADPGMAMFVVIVVDERGHERFCVGETGGVACQAAAVLDLLVLVQHPVNR